MVKSQLMAGKKGLIMGVANDRSIAWGIARELYAHGAELAFTYQGDQILKRLAPLSEQVNSDTLISCDVSNDSDVEKTFKTLGKKWSEIDFIVHSIAYSNKEELKGRYVDTTLDNFLNTMHISCYSFTSVMKYAEPMMAENGGSALTLTYYGSQKVMPNYNVMGVAKAALETSVKYLASDLGENNIRINALSAGPMKTLAGSAIASARDTYRHNIETAPLKRAVTLEEVGGSALYLLSDLSGAVTGETHYVDCGFNGMGMKKQG